MYPYKRHLYISLLYNNFHFKISFIKKSDFISWILLFLNSKFHLINYLIYN
jgi:hypothetical protein